MLSLYFAGESYKIAMVDKEIVGGGEEGRLTAYDAEHNLQLFVGGTIRSPIT